MIVCCCNGLRERDVRSTVRPDCRRLSRVFDRLGCRPKCKQCLPFAFEVVLDEQARRQVL